ncbi:MAG TPA: sulfatase-like hydrolase/transferase [Lacunisphaera sp.]
MKKLARWLALLPWLADLAGAAGPVPSAQPVERPNILWLTTEDISPNLGSYGDPDASTPTLDQLAARGTRYTRAFSVAGVCAPSRSSLITGVYASSLGSQHMRCQTTLPAVIQPLPALLRAAGYYCTNNSKEDYNFATPPGTWNDSSRTAHWRKRTAGQPFFSVFNFMTTHESRLRYEPEALAKLTQSLTPAQRHDPARVTLPAWLPDTPAVRTEWARYHDLISAMDHQVAAILQQLADDGLADDTIVVFTSDHGAGLPRAKQFIYEAGLQVPLIVHVPEKWRRLMPSAPGAAETRMVSLVDLPVSMLSLLGLPIPPEMAGTAFLGPQAAAPRAYIHAIRDRMDERVDMSRTVSDGRFKYHRNYLPHLPHYPLLTYMDLLETAKDFRRLNAAGQLSPGLAFFMAPAKPLEELYDLQADPNELHNLSADPAQGATLARLRDEHFNWVRRTVDTGFIPEQMLRDFAAGRSEYEYARSGDYQLERCIATVRLLEQGAAAVTPLRQALQDAYPPVRFWAATGLASLGRSAAPAAADLQRALGDPHAEVALAAAEALGYLGQPAPALPLLERCLNDDRPVVRLAAANVVDRIGEQARPLIDTIRRIAGRKLKDDLSMMVEWALQAALRRLEAAPPAAAAAPAGGLTAVGVASIDITPPAPVRLHGFPRGVRSTSNTVVTHPIFAKALAIGSDAEKPVLLLATDLLGVSDEMREELLGRLEREAGFSDRTRFTLTASHNHSAPALRTVAPFVFRKPPTSEQAQEIKAYEEFLMERLFQVAVAALRDRQPARIAHGKGAAAFGINRRLVQDGRMTGFGDNPAGPADPDFPVLVVRDPSGGLRAVWFSYACHGVCWQKPSVHGDWMGVAQARLERAHPGAVFLYSNGCAGDINPVDRYFKGEDPETPGTLAAAEVERILASPLQPVRGAPQTRLARFALPLQAAPGAEQWKEQKDWYSRTMLEQLQRGEALPSSLPYVAQTWTFAEDLTIVFLAGEVFSDYGLRLKRDFRGKNLWVNAYANDVRAYIPTAAVLPEGGWEVDGSRLNYGVPARVAPEAEEILIRAVEAMLPGQFSPAAKPAPR